MKILHKSKRALPPPTQVIELINKLLAASNEELSQVLAEIDVWKCPRSDLNAWIKVLNRLDTLLDDAIREYDIDKLQTKDFSPSTKKLVSEILRFERLLLENSTNRKMYNSYDRINSLLFTSDLDVLVLALKLLLRPSQQYSAQPSVSQALHISTPRLRSLAMRWSNLRDYGISLADLAKPAVDLSILPAETKEVSFTFYRLIPHSPDKEKTMETESELPPASPKKSVPLLGGVVVYIDQATLQSRGAMEILDDAIQTHSIPDNEKFELLCRIRAAAVLAPGRESEREKLIIIRLLALAIFGHTHPENQATSSIFLYEPDLVSHVAELLQVDKDIPLSIQESAIAAIDSLARYRTKTQEVLTSVNAGVNHGILMALMRRTVQDIASPSSVLPNSFVEGLLTFVTCLSSHPSGGNMVVGAGIVPLLIQILENRLPERIPVVSKTMQLMDSVVYSYPNAFNLFCSARGVEILVERIADEIDIDVKEHGDMMKSREVYGSHGEIPVARAAVLKHILRSMHRMMQSSGTAEGLRGLIDTSILKSIKKIIEYRGLFGPSVLPIAINIMATFIHNEPTALPIIQEAGLPEAFYKSIEIGLEPAIEVIQSIPNAIGALCLNDVGQAQLAGRPSIIPAIFSIFTSDRHSKVLLEKENAVLIGTAIDELVRHHPRLKGAVFEAILSTIDKIYDLGLAYEPPSEIIHWYRLQAVHVPAEAEPIVDNDVPMPDADEPKGISPQVSKNESNSQTDDASKPHDNHIVSFIDILGRFLEGLFQHVAHLRDFLSTTDGLSRLGRLTALPCLPYDFSNSVASDSMVQVMRTMTEIATGDTLTTLTQLVHESLLQTKDFWNGEGTSSKLLQFVDLSSANEVNANRTFRDLVTLHNRITLLSDVFATAGYAHGRAAITLLQTLMSNTSAQVVSDLGALHRAAIWESIVLKEALVTKGITIAQTPAQSPLDQSPEQPAVPLPEAEEPNSTIANIVNGAASPNHDVPVPVVTPTLKVTVKQNGPRDQNALALKHLTKDLPSALTPFFQAMVKMFHARRTPDAAQKKQMTESSQIVANIIVHHLRDVQSGDKCLVYAYYSVMLGLITTLLVEERTTTNPLYTVQLHALYRLGGLNEIFNVCEQFMSSIDRLTLIPAQSRSDLESQELLHAYGGLKVALHLIHPLVSSKPLLESGQTTILSTRDKQETDPDYFETYNFIVRLRVAAVPLLQKLWLAQWLPHAPLNVCRSIVQTVLEVAAGDNEEGKVDVEASSTMLPSRASNIMDEGRIRQITDMGFPRSAAERALTRTGNNVSAATELLLAQPFLFAAEPSAEAEADSSTSVNSPLETDGPSQDGADASVSENKPLESNNTPPIEGKTSEQWRHELSALRDPLRGSISRRALLLVDEHPSLIFDLQTAFTRPSHAHQQKAVKDLIDDIAEFSPSAYDVQEQPLANRCRLLALVLCETPNSVESEQRSILIERLLALLLSNPVRIDDAKHPTIPKWLAAHLLVVEVLFTLADEPRVITLPSEGDQIAEEALYSGPRLMDSRTIVFDFCLRLLGVPDLPSDEFLSTLRLLVLLTRNPEMASQFVKRDGVSMIFGRLSEAAVNGSTSYVAIILRHIAEDKETLLRIMNQAVKRYLAQPRTRPVDVATYVKNCSAMALRDPEAFVTVSKSLSQLGSPWHTPHTISLAPQVTGADNDKTSADPMAMAIDSPSMTNPGATNATLESVIHFLLTDLMKSTKTTHEQSPQQDSTSSETAQAKDQNRYACFIMQCITELLFSYDSCKSAFLAFSPKKKTGASTKDNVPRYRMVGLQFLLSDLITYGSLNPQPDHNVGDKISVCNWAMSIIVALCVDSSSTTDAKEVSTELLGVRRFVLEALSRAIKDLPATEMEDPEAKYGRLLALVDLCHRLLTVRFNTTSRKLHDDSTPTHIAKVMLEKNFVSTLTTALADVDLNYPHVRGLVASILRPLEYLSKIAIKMNKASSKGKEAFEDQQSETSSSSLSDDEEQEGDTTGREETPDLYRNSALGMYGGEMDDTHYTEDEEMDDIDEEGSEDEEMDFADQTGSEDTSESEDEVMDASMEPATGEWDDVDEDGEEDDDLVENDAEEEQRSEDSEVNEDNADEDDEEDGPDIMWQDIGDDQDTGEGEEEEEEEAPMHTLHDHDVEGERELMSEDEFGHILDINDEGDARDMFDFGDIIARNGAGLFVPRRQRGPGDENIQIFGRTRSAPASPPEATTHPLLLDTASAQRASGSQGHHGRTQRIITGGTNELLQTIEELVGAGGMHLFHHVLTRGRGGGAEAIRVDMPGATLVGLDRNFMSRRGHGASIIPPMRVDRPRTQPMPVQGRDLEPLLTLQRWTEEVKILHGDFVSERAAKLANHIILALLPPAIEAAAQAKAREEENRKLLEAEDARKSDVHPETSVMDTQVTRDVPEPPSKEEQRTEMSVDDASTPVQDVDTEMGDATTRASEQPPVEEQSAGQSPATSDTPPEPSTSLSESDSILQAAAPSEEPTPESSEQPAEASSSATQTSSEAPARVTVMIHGSSVDITDTGIDPTFLEALPDDMREEVLNQHIRDQRAARIERPADSQISPEFLDALPPEIRAEIIQQEAMERARRRAEEAAITGNAAVATDMDPASFIASLDPTLRQAVLMEQDDGFLQTLPSHMIAEAGAYRDGQPAIAVHMRPIGARSNRLASSSTPRRKTVQHDAIQLLDKSGVAVLSRLLFYPQVLRKNLLFRVLVNLCENSKTRSELFNLLLGVLQDGTADLATVDKSFAQMSVRGNKGQKSGLKQKTPDYIGSILPSGQSEAIPDLIAQRCLEALTYIVTANPQSSLFFLTEQETPSTLRRTASKKGKGKEKQAPQSTYPVVMLLCLLGRQALLRTPSMMESVVGLLATVTRPLTELKDPQDPPATEKDPAVTSDIPAEPSAEPLSNSAENPESSVTEPQVSQPTSDTEKPPAVLEPPKEPESHNLLTKPPQIQPSVLRLIVNILTAGECSARTFQQSLALIQHLSYIPDARDVIAQELRLTAQQCGQSLLTELERLSQALEKDRDDGSLGSVAATFSAPSSVQAKLLRVLKTIDYMYSPKPTSASTTSEADSAKVQEIYESFLFRPLWNRLGDCLAIIEQKPDTEHVATVLLPLIESLMVVCKHVGSKTSAMARALRGSSAVKSPSTPREAMEELFVSFTDDHRKILNLMVRNNPSLMSGSFSLLVHNPRVLDFDNKRNYFTQQLHRRPIAREHYGTLQLNIRRARVFEDSFHYLQRKTGDQIKYGKLSVRFYEEEGVDAGGLTREWFQILARQMFDPNNALFQPCAADRQTYQPNKNSWVNPEHLSFFKFVGRVIGKAIYDGRLLDAYFARSLYRQLLGKPVDYKDVEWVDPEYYNSLCWILENDPTPLELTFSVEADEFGVNRIVPLKPDGETIAVTQDNKREFVQLSAQYRLYSSIKEQIEHLSAGFYEIIPKDLVTIFNEQELELLISGTPDIDVDEWRAATEYNGYTSSDPNIVWWWRALKSFTRDERAKVLSFATGTSRVPLNGFADLQGVQGVQRFSIHKAYGEEDRLPQAHTCFNQIDLPQYSSYEMLRSRLLLAISEGAEGFGFV